MIGIFLIIIISIESDFFYLQLLVTCFIPNCMHLGNERKANLKSTL